MIDLKALEKAVGDLEEAQVLEMLDEFVASKPSEADGQKVIEACRQGMTKVGDLFASGEYFLGDLIFAGELLSGAVKKLKPVIGGGSSEAVGTMVLGTVKGDCMTSQEYLQEPGRSGRFPGLRHRHRRPDQPVRGKG
jgi:methanogenic corrinoid protein MtbC1